jgi:type IV pilus assembly protein PilY1
MFSRKFTVGLLGLLVVAQPFFAPFAVAKNTKSSGTTTTTTPSGHPQVLIAIGNSQSMDGNIQGAIMTGSGSGATNPTYLSPFSGGNYSGSGAMPVSPDTYTTIVQAD